MNTETAPEDSPRSPCTNVCRLDANGDICVGCHRTLDEIVAWGEADDAEKRAILASVERRRAIVPISSADRGK
ncbi:MAG: hypothetical protein JWP38_3388 [Herbaspirillum sp.]|nr:hypothetical protein [Herbaspirillum sp.]